MGQREPGPGVGGGSWGVFLNPPDKRGFSPLGQGAPAKLGGVFWGPRFLGPFNREGLGGTFKQGRLKQVKLSCFNKVDYQRQEVFPQKYPGAERKLGNNGLGQKS